MKEIALLTSILLFAFVSCQKQASVEPEVVVPIVEKVQFTVPKNFPKLTYDLSQNPITTAGFELGKALFYDGILSKDGTISCGSCHIQSSGFTQHGHDLSHGINDLLTLRNSLPIQNLAWQPTFFWDGGVFQLDLFAIAPIEAHNEMDETLPNVLNKLRNTAKYPPMFAKAFGSTEITTGRFLKALSQFQLMCISANSQYDKYIRNEGVTLSDDELGGLQIFKQKCATCHAGELFSDFSYRNNGLPIGNPEDTGRARITLNEQDKYKFRVPSLRNVEVTLPYMHDGRFRTMEAVLNHYEKGIADSPTLDSQLKKGIALSAEEKRKLIAFLKTLTDELFIENRLLSEF
ncbi:MAG: cytochrome-c peroxidase [Cytophagales bacterium]|nr:MAG: cytochrome-c peroxidase [Cytophagales bacterium]